MSTFQPKNLTHLNHSKFLKLSMPDTNEFGKKEHIKWYYKDLEQFLNKQKDKNSLFKKSTLDFFTQRLVFLIWINALTEDQVKAFQQNGFKEEISLAYKDIEESTKNW